MSLPDPLNQLAPDSQRIIEQRFHPVEFPSGTCIFEIDAPGDTCYIIDEGRIRLEIPPEGSNPDDHENVLSYLEAGSMLGELALLDRLPRSASAYAHTDVKMRYLSTADLGEIAQANPLVVSEFYAALGRVASLKLRSITGRLAGYIFKEYNPMVEDMVTRAQAAQQAFADWPEERIDSLLNGLAQAVHDHAEELARLNVEETGIGNVPDKITKIRVGSLGVYKTLAGEIGYGVGGTEAHGKVVDIIAPFGLVLGLVPVTNPVSTFIFKVLVCLKGRNAVILCPSRRSVRTASRVGEIVQGVLAESGAPVDLVQWVSKNNSRKTTSDFMKHGGVRFILATGGPSMVKAAYSSGTPAIGVGSGNAPVLVCADADLDQAVEHIIASKTFDNGMVCCSEHNLVADARVRAAFITKLEQAGTAVLTPDEIARFTAKVVDAEKNQFSDAVIGQSAAVIAALAGIQRTYPIRLIVVSVDRVDPQNVYSHEKLAPILSLFTARDEDEGIRISSELLSIDGTGHTAIIYTLDERLSARFAQEVPASRILVNAPGVQGGIGVVTGLVPSLTLGCGTFGGNSTTDNVTYRHLVNVKRLAYYAPEEGVFAED